MSRSAPNTLFTHIEAFFTDYLPMQRGASVHTVRAYRDALTLLLRFAAQRLGRAVVSLELADLDAAMVMRFLDHIEAERSNTAATRNCRRAAIRSFFKHLLRNDLMHAQQYARVLAIPAKKSRQRPATYLEADEVRAIVAVPDRRTTQGWRDYTVSVAPAPYWQRPPKSDIDDVAQQAERHSPARAVRGFHRCAALVDPHDGADLGLHVAVLERHLLAAAEVIPARL